MAKATKRKSKRVEAEPPKEETLHERLMRQARERDERSKQRAREAIAAAPKSRRPFVSLKRIPGSGSGFEIMVWEYNPQHRGPVIESPKSPDWTMLAFIGGAPTFEKADEAARALADELGIKYDPTQIDNDNNKS